MTRKSVQGDVQEPDFSIALEKICFIIIKAREFDAKEEPTDPDDASNPADDHGISVLEDNADDPVLEELESLISSLSIDEQIDVVALMWLGRDDYEADDWESVRSDAADAHNERTAQYLCGTPLLADHLSNGLAVFNRDCSEFERAHL